MAQQLSGGGCAVDPSVGVLRTSCGGEGTGPSNYGEILENRVDLMRNSGKLGATAHQGRSPGHVSSTSLASFLVSAANEKAEVGAS